MAGAGAPRGLPGERPPSGGGGGRELRPPVHGVHVRPRRRRPASLPSVNGRTASGSRASPPRGDRRRRRPRSVPVRDPGTRKSLPGYRGGPVLPGGGPVSRAGCAADVCASLEGPRAAQGRVGGGRGENSHASKSVGGRECTVGGEPVAARDRPAACIVLRDRVVGHGHPGKWAAGLGVLGVERRTASGGWLPWSRELHSVRRGLAPISEAARGNREPGSPAGHRGPGPGRFPHRTRGPAGASRWPGSVQGVRAVLRRGRPLLHGGPAASTAVRSTPDRGD